MSAGSVDDKHLKELLAHIYLPLTEKIPLFGPKRKVIVICGPTGTGKTDLSLSLAKLIDGEIISADSMQVYRNMDIGTAKASKEEMKEVPHHLVDILEVNDSFNVMRYFEEGSKALRSITARGKVPIVVGGSGFYIQTLLYGPPPGPTSDPEIRKKIEHQMDQLGCEVLYEQLQMLDPEYAKTITEKDKHKIIRAMEIMTISERKVSDFQIPTRIRNDEYDFRLWFIYYPKEILYPKIEMRCDQMIQKGFIDEVMKLKKEGLEENKSASSAIGYKQCLEYLDSDKTEDDYRKFLYEFKKASRNYAKRQFTWFRKEPNFRWINLSDVDLEHLRELILQDFEQS